MLSTSGVMLPNGEAVIGSWCGAVVNTIGVYDGATFVAGTHLVCWGGGHTVSWDEMYAYGPFESSDTTVRKWRRLRDRTSPIIQNADEDSAGNPVSRHTYATMVYDSNRNQLLTMGGLYRYTDTANPFQTHRFNFNTPNPNTSQPWSKGASVPTNAAYAAVFDKATDQVWYRPANRNEVAVYNRATNTFQVLSGKTPPMNDDSAAAALDEKRGLFYQIGTNHGFYRTNNGVANDYYVPSTTGTAPLLNTYGALLRDPVADRFVVWMNSGKTLYFLTPPSTNPYQGGNPWVWSSVTPSSGATPSAANATGTYGRFAYVAFGNGEAIYVLLNQASESIYFYRAR